MGRQYTEDTNEKKVYHPKLALVIQEIEVKIKTEYCFFAYQIGKDRRRTATLKAQGII